MASAVLDQARFLLAETPTHVVVAHRTGKQPELRFDRKTGKVALTAPEKLSQARPVFGVLGTIDLLAGTYVLVITRAQPLGTLRGSYVYRVLAAEVVPVHTEGDIDGDLRSDEAEYVTLLRTVITGGTFYFSYETDLTSSQQRQSAIDHRLPLCSRADDQFFFNRAVQATLLGLKAFDYVLPVIQGFVQIDEHDIGGKSFRYVLVSRRSRFRAGTRYNVRGVDDKGHAANFVETEQIVETRDHVSALLQTRGSIPLLWTQQPALKYKARIVLSKDSATSERAFRLHTEGHVARYGPTTIVDLIDQRGSEKQLGALFAALAAKAAPLPLRYVAFDFHKECAKMRYDRLTALMATLQANLDDYGFYVAPTDGIPTRSQRGVVRTNCIDCLDRTNVVQSLVARTLLPRQLRALGVFADADTVAAFPALDGALKHLWANNADALSIQYSGTPALKTDFTRTGKRTVQGSLQDGWHSAKRYVLANFRDGRRQDGIDLFAGNYAVVKGTPSPLRGSHPAAQMVLIAVLVLVAMVAARLAFPSVDRTAYVRVGLELVLVYVLWRILVRFGDRFVLRPRLVKHHLTS